MAELIPQPYDASEASLHDIRDNFEDQKQETYRKKYSQIAYLTEHELKKFDSKYHTLDKKFTSQEYSTFEEWKQAFEEQTELAKKTYLLRKIPFSKNSELVLNYLFGDGGIFDQMKEHSNQVLQDFYEDKPFTSSDFIAEYITIKHTFSAIVWEKDKTTKEQLFIVFVQKFIQRYEEISKTQLFHIKNRLSYPSSQMEEDAYENFFGVYVPGSEFEKLAHELIYEISKIFSNKKEAIQTIIKVVTSLEARDINEVAARFLSKIDAALAAETLLTQIQDIEKSKEQKIKFGEILHRIELGKPISVTNQTVEYLQKKYHLKGEIAPKALSAIRIDPNGKLGLLDQNETLIGYIEFGDFENIDDKEAKIIELSTELFFLSTPLSNDEQSTQEKEINEFRQKYYREFYCEFNTTQTGVYLNNLSLPEQFHFYQFLKNNKNEETKNKVKFGAQEFGYPFVKAFLSLQFDTSAPEKILSLVEKYKNGIVSKRDVEMIFLRYEQLLQRAVNIDTELKRFFTKPEKVSSIDAKGATTEIMKRAGVLFANLSAENTDDETLRQNIQNALQKIDANLTVFSSLFKIAVNENGGSVEYADIQGLDFYDESIQSVRNNHDLLAKMMQIVKENRKDRGEKAMEAAEKDFETFLQENEGSVYLLQKNSELLSFIIFSPLSSGETNEKPHKIARSFNVKCTYRGSGIGESMMAHTLQKESDQSVLHAVVKPDIDVRRRYIEDIGFTITGVDEKYYGPNSPMLTIVCEKEKYFSTRALTPKECLTLFEKQTTASLEIFLQNKEPIICVAIDTKNITHFSEIVKKCTGQGYVGTREILLSSENKQPSLFIFELDPSSEYTESPFSLAA